jgi:hypothetical protein
MRRYLLFTVFVFLLAIGGNNVISAQSPQFSIFDSFEQRAKPGEGTVVVHQSEAIKKLVGTRIDNENVVISEGKTFLTTRGYRIQVYSGNLAASRAEAERLAGRIKELFPGLETDIKFSAPFWRLFVGNYLFHEEAATVRRELMRVFPQQRNEINIFEDDIRLLLD